MKTIFPIDKFQSLETPFYYYDMELLHRTLDELSHLCGGSTNRHVYYAVKANANRRLLELIAKKGFGADCVSGGEIQRALEAGFPARKIVFAGVGKTDKEINYALSQDIFCFNVESLPELEVINELAGVQGKIARVALRINPEVKADTHAHITTGTAENKFGIGLEQLEEIIVRMREMTFVTLIGLHFHIGSQILRMENFIRLAERINEIQAILEAKGVVLEHINVGGGLGVDYEHPDEACIADFVAYFSVYEQYLRLKKHQHLHFELGRSVVAQCGTLITKVTYIKQGIQKRFAILDAGMTDLLRSALYGAYHKIENLTSDLPVQAYDVVGPVCESSDTFGQAVPLTEVRRGDLIAIRSAGAYGEVMASTYNCRELPPYYFSDML